MTSTVTTRTKPITLAVRRRSRGWTQEDLAQRAGVARITVARLEAARPPYEAPALATVVGLARALGVGVSTLLDAIRRGRA
jgi:transcriptional regulator with XRE-family HTH domain